MKKITLSIIIISSFLISKAQNSFPYLYVGSANPVTISDGLIRPQTNSDGQSLEIHATKFNVGQINYQTYANNNTAILNCATNWDGSEMVRFRTLNNTGYYSMVQVLPDKFVASFVQDGQPQLYLSANSNNSIGVATNAPNVNAKLDVNGNIFSNGKIAIGITDMAKIGSNSLAVNGSAIFTKATVKLNANWPDYVFHKEYQLPSLDELEQFIKLNGHLPEVPTADEAEKNGIDIGDNQALLLKKIEELTLFAIDQNKRIEEQSKTIRELKEAFQKISTSR